MLRNNKITVHKIGVSFLLSSYWGMFFGLIYEIIEVVNKFQYNSEFAGLRFLRPVNMQQVSVRPLNLIITSR